MTWNRMVIDTDAKLLKLIIAYKDKTKFPLAAMKEKSGRASKYEKGPPLPCRGCYAIRRGALPLEGSSRRRWLRVSPLSALAESIEVLRDRIDPKGISL